MQLDKHLRHVFVSFNSTIDHILIVSSKNYSINLTLSKYLLGINATHFPLSPLGPIKVCLVMCKGISNIVDSSHQQKQTNKYILTFLLLMIIQLTHCILAANYYSLLLCATEPATMENSY